MLKNTGIEKAVLQNKAVFLWDEAVGEAIARNAQATEVKHGIVMIKASTPVWRNELVLRKREIVKNLNNLIGKRVIKDIRFI